MLTLPRLALNPQPSCCEANHCATKTGHMVNIIPRYQHVVIVIVCMLAELDSLFMHRLQN